MNVTLTMVQFVTVVVAVFGAFSTMFWALQRYIAGQIKTVATDVSSDVKDAIDRFDQHATKFETKLDALVEQMSGIGRVLTGVSSEHGARLESLEGWIARVEKRVVDSERANRGS